MRKGLAQKFSGSVDRLRRHRNFKKDFKSALICRKLELSSPNTKEPAQMRVAHITDQHVGRVTPMELQRAAISLVNEAKPDIVLLTGDFVCHSELFLEDLSFLLGQLSAPAFAVLGNHDHWTNAQAVKKALSKASVTILENANTLIEIKGQKLQLVGIDDAYTQHDDIGLATKGMKKHYFTIGLSHIAEKADELWPHGIDLVLSGHTHAGQVTVAKLNELVLGKIVGHKYIHGLYQSNDSALKGHSVYVGAGVGSAIIPFRFGEKAKREVTIFDIHPQNS